MPVRLTPLPPFLGRPVAGSLVDLSAGGMAVLIPAELPPKARLHLTLTFPDGRLLSCPIVIQRIARYERGFVTGIEFVKLDDAGRRLIDCMSMDFNDCESRIRANAAACRPDCAFFALCDKPQRSEAPAAVAPFLTLELTRRVA